MHQAVLLHEVVDYLRLSPGKKILDCTVGYGGHARAILERITPGGILIGIDQDESAVKKAFDTLTEFKENSYLVHDNFKNLETILAKYNIEEVDGVLFDLGISSLQLEEGERGFSIKLCGPLDMRMDRRLKLTAAHLVNKLKETEIAEILYKYGQERLSRRIARAIVVNRPITTTRGLAEIVRKALPFKTRYGRIHPATKTFQALRIAVNDELRTLDYALSIIPRFIKKEGRICVISFHSLEDRIVKNRYREWEKKDIFKIITKKPVTPQREELLINPRSRSAKLRVAEKL